MFFCAAYTTRAQVNVVLGLAELLTLVRSEL